MEKFEDDNLYLSFSWKTIIYSRQSNGLGGGGRSSPSQGRSQELGKGGGQKSSMYGMNHNIYLTQYPTILNCYTIPRTQMPGNCYFY